MSKKEIIITKDLKIKHGSISHNEKNYDLVFGRPDSMLDDDRISWESKGFLSYLCLLPGECKLSVSCIEDLIRSGYLVEVKV